MLFRLKTAERTQQILEDLYSSTNLTPNILSRIAISLSLLDEKTGIENINYDSRGIEFNRNTLTGDLDFIYKSLIAQSLSREITDEEYFPGLIKKHLDRGARLLESEYRYAGNYEKFLSSIASLDIEVLR